MALIKTILEIRPNNEIWYKINSDTEGKCVLQVETGIYYGGVTITNTDPYTYEEADDPNWYIDIKNKDGGDLPWP